MSFARRLGYTEGPLPYRVHLDKENYAAACDFLNKRLVGANYICINASYLKSEHWPLKHWGNDKYVELIKQLAVKTQYRIVFIGDKQDYRDAEDIIQRAEVVTGADYCVNACGFSKDIKNTAALLSGAVLNIGNDSGLQHVAAAVDIPTIAIFTFTNPIKNRPLSNKSISVMNPCGERIMCQHGRYNQCADKGCLDIPVENVMHAVQKVLKGDSNGQKTTQGQET
jgi:heptosyltransferase-2